jgi:flagellar capping protein FliD
MSDIYVPGLSSRFNSDKVIEDLMRLERVPRDRIVSNIEQVQKEKKYWQDLSNTTKTLRESASQLFSYNNPFNDRNVTSSDESVLTGTAKRDAAQQDLSFTVKQIAQADRFLSSPLQENFKVEAGIYSFLIGKEEVSFDFKGGTLKDFSDTLNRRGRDLIQSSLIAVKSGTKSLLIESKVTGEDNSLIFSGASLALGADTGMIEVYNGEDGTQAQLRPLNAVSTARDAIVSMEGIEVYRPSNEIDDLLPGVTLKLKGTSDRPVRLQVEMDTEGVKDAIITFIGNYNRLMAEINVLTARSSFSELSGSAYKTNVDETVLNELTYLTADERAEMRNRLGVFNSDSTLSQIRNTLMRIVSDSYPNTADESLNLLVQIGIGTDIRRTGGANPSKLRGYLEIDEKILDSAIATNLPAVKQLFGSDTTGDLIVNTGIAYSIDALAKPYVESTGIFALKANNIDARIQQDTRRIETLDRQLAAKEADLKRQYSQMEGAYNRMEQMGNSLDRFQLQNNNNR